VVAVGILMICFVCFPVGWPPSWISGTCRRSTKPEVPPLESCCCCCWCLIHCRERWWHESMTPKNMGIAVGILSLCALELKICLGVCNMSVFWDTWKLTHFSKFRIQILQRAWDSWAVLICYSQCYRLTILKNSACWEFFP